MSIRTGIEVALGLALLIAVYFFFTQSNTLSDTEALLESANEASTSVALELADAQGEATQLAETANEASTSAALELADAQSEATQLAETANEASTSAALELADAQSEATQLVEAANEASTSAALELADAQSEAATREAHIVATATQSAMEAAVALSAMESSATQNAETISSLEAEVTEQAQILADTVATSSAIQTLLDDNVSQAATQLAELETARNTISEQATALAETSVTDSDSVPPPIKDVSSLEVPDDYVLFQTKEFQLYVPSDFLVFDIVKQQDEAIETFTELGEVYDSLAESAREGTTSAVVLGALDAPDVFISVDNLVIATEEVFFPIPLDSYLEGMASFFPGDTEVLVQEVITINERDFGRSVIAMDFGFLDAFVIIYVTMEDDNIYIMIYTTTGNNFAERQAGYEASLGSFTFR